MKTLASQLGSRAKWVNSETTTAYRLIHGGSDSFPGWYVDRLGNGLLSQGKEPLTSEQSTLLQDWLTPVPSMPPAWTPNSVYHKILNRQVGQTSPEESAPRFIMGSRLETPFTAQEHNLHYELSFEEGYSVGLFLDQRENRRKLLQAKSIASLPVYPRDPRQCEVLNTFAYTCAFSVCAASAGARVTSVDLSRKYLDWGKRNFQLNDLPDGEHDFIFGDVFRWIKQLGRKGRRFDVIILDPPTFSRSKESGVFRAEKDYAKLVTEAIRLLGSPGILLASTNAAKLGWDDFLEMVNEGIREGGRQVIQSHRESQPHDFPISKSEPAYLKTVWLHVD